VDGSGVPIDVCVQSNSLEGMRWHEALPVAEGLEGIVDEDDRVALPTATVREADVTVAVNV
jgi:hypothetical protein